MTTPDLFYEQARGERSREEFAPGAYILRGFALGCDAELLSAIADVLAVTPLRHLTTPGGYGMSVAMSNCGSLGWVSDRRGYRYDSRDPMTGRDWPALPAIFQDLAAEASRAASYSAFLPEACLINCYRPGSRLSLHQDKDELNLDAPIVSVSLGVPATFLFGGCSRKERTRRVPVFHGDVAVWGGPSRLAYHGIAPLKTTTHPLTGECRFNLTFRKVN